MTEFKRTFSDTFNVEYSDVSPRLVLIRGGHNTGKTELAKYLCRTDSTHMTVHLETDMYMTNREGERVVQKEKLHDAHKWVRETAGLLLNTGHSVVIANTFIKLWELDRYIMLAVSRGLSYAILKTRFEYPNVKGHPTTLLQSQRDSYEAYTQADI